MYFELFTERVLHFIELNKTTVRSVSLDLGHSASYISKVLNGSIKPPLSLLIEICECFDVTPAEFLSPYYKNQEVIREIERELKGNNGECLQSLCYFLKSAKLK